MKFRCEKNLLYKNKNKPVSLIENNLGIPKLNFLLTNFSTTGASGPSAGSEDVIGMM